MTTFQITYATCKRCAFPVVTTDPGTAKPYWLHADPSNGMPLDMGRGCRSASYSRLGTWDESMDRKWTATPDKGTERQTLTTEAEALARATGSVAATVTNQRRGLDGILHTDDVDVYVRPPARVGHTPEARDAYYDAGVAAVAHLEAVTALIYVAAAHGPGRAFDYAHEVGLVASVVPVDSDYAHKVMAEALLAPEDRTPPEAVECPRCEAPAGEPCRNSAGRSLGTRHHFNRTNDAYGLDAANAARLYPEVTK